MQVSLAHCEHDASKCLSLTGVDIDVLVASLCSSPKDENLLRVTVRHRGDLAVWKLRSQVYRDRAPATSQVDDRHAVDYAGSLYVHIQHVYLTLSKSGVFIFPEAAGVLQVGPQHCVIELVGHLIMLLVGWEK